MAKTLLVCVSLTFALGVGVGCASDGGTAATDPALASLPCAGACAAGELCSFDACSQPAADTCDTVGFSMTSDAAIARFGGGQTKVRYVASNVIAGVEVRPAFDKILVELTLERFFAGATPGPGSWDLAAMDTNDRTSALFVRGYTYCNDFDCAFPYIVKSGTLELEVAGTPGTSLTGYLRALTLEQVRIDDLTGAIIPFSKGKVWCVGDVRIDKPVAELSTAQGSCVAEGTGDKIGDNIRDFTLTNCNGDQVDVHSLCGQSKALWIVATAGWCGACEAFVPMAAERYDEERDNGLELMVVYGETAARTQPTLEGCTAYALGKGLDPAIVYIDHDGTRSWPVTWDAIDTYSGGSIGLPWNALLDGRSMEYVWSSNAGSGDLYLVQDELLERQ